jgi:hypothetical protein
MFLFADTPPIYLCMFLALLAPYLIARKARVKATSLDWLALFVSLAGLVLVFVYPWAGLSMLMLSVALSSLSFANG